MSEVIEHEEIINTTMASGAAGSVIVRLLDGGSLATADISIIHAGAGSVPFRLYDWCFYIFHEPSDTHLLWDVGISSNRSDYTPYVLANQWPSANPVGPRRTVRQQLEDQGVSIEQIKTVIFSHAHWDHCRPIKEEFPAAKVWFGPGTGKHCSPGHLRADHLAPESQWDGRLFDPQGATETWSELEGPWVKWGPFDRAMDYFGDGSFWVIEAPGHMPGNLCAAARLQESDSWVVLASDCCHTRAILSGDNEIAVLETPTGSTFCLHTDLTAAHKTIARLREAELMHGMHIAMAHDTEWMKEGNDPVLMSLLTPDMKGRWLSQVRLGEAP